MLLLIPVFAFISLFLSAPAWYLGRKRVKWSKRDYAIALYSNILASGMIYLSIDSPYTLNFLYAAIFAFMFSTGLPWIRLCIKRFSNTISFWFYLLPIFPSVILAIYALFSEMPWAF